MPSQSLKVLGQLQSIYGTSDWQSWSPYPQPYYDLISYPAAGTTSLDFFAVPGGQNDPVSGVQKTIEDTNVQVSRQLGQNFLWVLQIRTAVWLKPKARQPTAMATDANLLYRSLVGMASKWWELFNRGVLELYIDNKLYVQIERPFVHAPAGMGLAISSYASAGTSAPAVAADWFIQNNPDEANIWVEDPGLWIGPTQTITATLKYPDGTGPVFTNLVDSASPAIQVACILGGYMFRASQ